MKFPEIKRAKEYECFLKAIPRVPCYVYTSEQIKEERLSRAKWAKALAEELEDVNLNLLTHLANAQPDIGGGIKESNDLVEKIKKSLLRQAELDEEGGLK